MSAIKKPHEHHPEPETEAEGPVSSPVQDVADTENVEATESPARSMQERLQQSIQTPAPRTRLMDTGRVLAAASGITTLLGVFFFYGIW